MPQESYPFPMYSGLLEPSHYKKIGNAIWLFLWCVSATTKDIEKDGVTWGIVLGNKPVKREELAAQFGVAERTVQRWIESLEQHGYIKITRAPYGMIFTVRNSKKFKNSPDRNVRSDIERVDKTVQSDVPEWTQTSTLQDKTVHSNKDITEDIIKDLVVVVVDEQEQVQIIQEIENHFIQRRGKGFAVSPSDFLEIKQLVAAGVPSPLIKTCIDRAFDEYRPRHSRDEIRSFNFIVPRIYDEWEKSKAITAAVPHVAVALGSDKQEIKPYQNKQQQRSSRAAELRRQVEEGRKSDQG